MTVRHTAPTPAHLTDAALEVAIRTHIAEARRRPSLTPFLRQYIAAELDELKAEAVHARPKGPRPYHTRTRDEVSA